MAVVASAVSRATTLWSCSSVRGMKTITTMPTTGRKTPTGSSQSLAVSVR